MSRNASGIYTLPSQYNPVVAKTTILKDWANTTLTDIASEITNSLDRSGRGAMTAPLQLPDGTAALPALTFSGDTDTGLYRSAANTLAFSTGGTQRGTWDSTALTIATALAVSGQVKAADGAVGAPGLSFSNDTDCGLYRAGANDIRLAANGLDIAKATTKLSVSAATAATGGTRQDALSLTNGDLDLSGVTQPDSTTALTNRLAAPLVPKAWAQFSMSGAATYAITVNDACNITSIVRGTATRIDVTIAGDMASANYAVVGSTDRAGSAVNPISLAAGTFSLTLSRDAGFETLDGLGTVVIFHIVVFGRQ